MKRPGGSAIGQLGEDIVCRYLSEQGFSIIEQNYRKKWGELDIVARKGKALHFLEVKTVSGGVSGYRPEENVHPQKLKRISRAIQTYLLERNIPDSQEWQFDVAIVMLDVAAGEARIRYLSDAVL